MELRQLRYFLEIVACGGFTKAAGKLHIAQPALSIAIGKLEEELGAPLFTRSHRKIALTAEGEAFHRHAQSVLQGVALAKQEIADLKGLLKGEVRVGLTPMLSSFFFPKIISTFKRLHPALQISIYGESAGSIQRMIETGELDMGVIAGQVPAGIEHHHLLREEVVACIHKSHPLARRKSVSLRELSGKPLIHFKAGYSLREMVDAAFTREGFFPAVVAETNMFSLVRSLVKEELGLAFLLRMVVARDPEVAAVSCDPPLFLDLSIAWKKNAALSPANRAFVEFLKRELDEYYLVAQQAATFPLP